MNTIAIANHLNVAADAIVEVQEWARVLWVRVRGLGARFVSKKVGQKMEATEATETVLMTAVRIAKKQNELMDLWNRQGDEAAFGQYHELTDSHDKAFRQLSREERREYMRLVD
jgi:hypothetical protein